MKLLNNILGIFGLEAVKKNKLTALKKALNHNSHVYELAEQFLQEKKAVA